MRPLLTALVCLGGICGIARGDGYPFDSKTLEVLGDSMRFRLNSEQITSISSSGLITLSPEQLAAVRRLYPAAAPTQAVVAATFNDNNEGLDSDDVYCFWVRADELAVTINHTVVADASKAAKSLSGPGEGTIDTAALRISPDGELYHQGKPITLGEAFRLIDSVERPKKPGDYVDFRVVVPPPYVPDRPLSEGTANSKVRELLTALESYGEAQGVPVFRSW